MLKGLRANAILTIVVALLLSAFLARQEQSRASRSEESASGKTPITSPSRMAPKGIPDNPTLSRKEFLSVEERLGLENPPPLLLESLNVLLSPPMIAEIQAQAVETRIQWETEGLDHLPELLTVLQDEAPETRVLAAILLGSLRSPEVIPHLENRLKVEQSELVRCALLAGLADCGQTPREHGENLLHKYLTLRAGTLPQTDVDGWRLALMIGSIQGPELTEVLRVVRNNTDGGLGPLVQGSIEIRALYQQRML